MTKIIQIRNEIKLNNVRIEYPQLLEAKSYEVKGIVTKPKYSAIFILNKDDHKKEIFQINEWIDTVLLPHGVKKEKLILQGYAKLPLQDGNLFEKKEYENSYILKTSSLKAPWVLDKQKKRITDETAIYGGCYVNALVSVWVYNNGGMGVGSNLNAVQFVKHGEPFSGGGVNIDGKFDVIENDDEDDHVPF